MLDCNKCHRPFPVDSFYADKRYKNGVYPYCQECRKGYWRDDDRRAKRKLYDMLRRYGVTEAHYKELVASQDGKCAICCTEPESRQLHIDHDHKSGKVRGLLCHKCNNGIGLFSDSVQLLTSAVDYLISSTKCA